MRRAPDGMRLYIDTSVYVDPELLAALHAEADRYPTGTAPRSSGAPAGAICGAWRSAEPARRKPRPRRTASEQVKAQRNASERPATPQPKIHAKGAARTRACGERQKERRAEAPRGWTNAELGQGARDLQIALGMNARPGDATAAALLGGTPLETLRRVPAHLAPVRIMKPCGTREKMRQRRCNAPIADMR
jgi:hypothetical protein